MLGSKLDILKQEWIDVVFSNRIKPMALTS